MIAAMSPWRSPNYETGAKERIAGLEDTVAERDETIAHLAATVEKLEGSMECQLAGAMAAQTDIGQRTANKIQQLEEQLATALRWNNTLEDEAQTQADMHAITIEQLTKAIRQTEVDASTIGQLTEANASNATSAEKVDEMIKELQTDSLHALQGLEAEVRTKEAHCEETIEQYVQAEAIQAEMTSEMIAMLSTQDEAVEDLKAKLAAKDAVVRTLAFAIEGLKAELGEKDTYFTRAEATITDLEAQLGAKRTEVNAQAENLDAFTQALTAKIDMIDGLEAQLRAKNTEFDKLEFLYVQAVEQNHKGSTNANTRRSRLDDAKDGWHATP
jgi:chromosome segregation ATPase